MCEPKYTRYVTMGLRDGRLHRLYARRGHTPDDIIRQTLLTATPHPFLSETGKNRPFDRLYLLIVGDEGTYGNSTNLRLKEIVPVPPVPVPAYSLVDAPSGF